MDIIQILQERIKELKDTLLNATSSHVRLDAKDQLKINYNILNPALDTPCPCTKCDKFYTCSKAFLDYMNCKNVNCLK